MKSMSDFWVGIFVLLGIISIVFLSFRVGSYNSFDKKNAFWIFKDGNVVSSYGSKIKPDSEELISKIEELL